MIVKIVTGTHLDLRKPWVQRLPHPLDRNRHTNPNSPQRVKIRFIQTIALPAAGLRIDCINMLANSKG
jgi:hypothetical protein